MQVFIREEDCIGGDAGLQQYYYIQQGENIVVSVTTKTN